MGKEDSFIQFLSELRAERRSRSFDQMTKRLIAQRDMRKFFMHLMEKGFIVQENLDEAIDFDFLIRKGDDELVGLLEYRENEFQLSRERIEQLYRILSQNPQSRVVLLVWIAGPSYPSVLLSLGDLNKILREGKAKYDFSSKHSPLKESVDFFFKRPDSLVFPLEPGRKEMVFQADKIMLSETFERLILSQFEKIKKTRFRLEYKVVAAEEFSNEDLRRLEKVFHAALNKDFNQHTLESCLNDISKAGGKRADKIN